MQAKHKWGNSTAKGTESYTSGVAGGRQDTAALPAQSHNVETAEPLLSTTTFSPKAWCLSYLTYQLPWYILSTAHHGKA